MAGKMPLMSMIGVIFLTYRRRLQRALIPHEITLKQVYLLRQLSRKEFLLPSQVAGMLFCDRPTATVIVANMERRGWVRREKDPANRKQIRIAATEAGRAKFQETAPVLAAAEAAAEPLNCLAPEERAQLETLLAKVYHGL